MNKNYRFVILLLWISLFSCKKEKDETAPVISFILPLANQAFNVYDYVSVNATVTDETRLTEVSVSLLDANHNPVHVTLPVSVSSPSMTVSIPYFLDNIHLLSGIYYIRIAATDGENDSYKYQKIYLVEVPRALKKVFLITNTSASQTNLSYIDSAFTSIIPFQTFTGDHLGTYISSYYQQANLCGKFTGKFLGFDLSNSLTKFAVSPVVSSTPYFTGYFGNELNSYVCRYDGSIRGYSHDGSVVFSASSVSGNYTQQLCFNDGHLIAEEKETFTTVKKLVTYLPNGSFENSCSLNLDVTALYEKDAGNVFVFGNSGGQPEIRLFDRINNNLWSPYPFTLSPGAMLSVLQIDPDTYLIGHSNGTIYKYQYSLNSVTTYLTGFIALKMTLDDLTGKLYVVETTKVSTFDYATAGPISSVNSAENILDLQFLYNR